MLEYPPRIVAADFVDPPVTVADQLGVDALEGARSTTTEAVTNPFDRPHFGVVELKLSSRLKSGFNSVSYADRGHADVPTGGPRFHFLPSAETVDIRWKLKGAEVIESAALQLYIRGKAEPVWEHRIDRSELVDTSQPLSSEDAERNLKSGVMAWDGRVPAGEQGGATTFPDEVVTAEHVLYKLRMVVKGPRNGKCVGAEAWTYFDVLVDRIELSWGDPNSLPPRTDVAAPLQPAILGFEQQILRDLSQEVRKTGTFDTPQEVVLDMNRFQRFGESTASRFEALRARWGDGPRVPVVAMLHLRKSDNSVDHSCPKVLGGTRVLWDWSDPRCDTPGQNRQRAEEWTRADASSRTKDYLETLFTRNRAAYSPPSFNCPVVYGGKHGPGGGATLVTPAGAADQDYSVPASRPWAIGARVPAAATESRTQIWFRPSRMAGDTYRIAAYVWPAQGWEDSDWSLSGPDLWQAAQSAHLPAARSGRTTVKHKVNVQSYKTNGVNYARQTVEDIYDVECGVKLTINESALNEADYLDAANERAIRDELRVNQLKNVSPLLTDVIRSDPTAMGLSFKKRDQAVQDAENTLRNQPLHQMQVTDPAAYGALGLDEVLRSTVNADNWRGMLVAKRDPDLVDVLTLEGSFPMGATLVSSRSATRFTPQNPQVNANDRTEIVNRCREAVRSGYATVAPEYGFGSAGKPVAEKRCSAYARRNTLDRTAVMFLFDKLRSNDDFPSGTAFAEAGTETLGIVAVGYPNLGARANDFKTAHAIIAHELGHALFFAHAVATKLSPAVAAILRQPNWSNNIDTLVTTGNRDNLLTALNLPAAPPTEALATTAIRIKDKSKPVNLPPMEPLQHEDSAPCLMNYDNDSNHFCALCLLRMRGWNVAHQQQLNLPDGDVVFVPRHGFPAKRIRVELGSSGRINGCDAKFTCPSDVVAFYDVPAGGVPHATGPRGFELHLTAAELAAGRTLYIEAVRSSAAKQDVVLILEAQVNPLANLPDDDRTLRARITAVDLRMDVFTYRKDSATPPRALSEEEKASPGAFLHLQDANKRHSRMRIVVHRPAPDSWDGEILLRSKDGRVGILTSQDVQSGNSAARAWASKATLIPPSGAELFIEGARVSSAVRDSELELGAGTQVSDRLRVTVINFANLTVSIPATPVRTDRSAAGIAPARNPSTFTVQPAFGTDFQPAETLVLVAKSLDYSPRLDQRAVLTANVNPPVGAAPNNLPLRWSVTRRTGPEKDSKDVVKLSPNETPTIYAQAGNQAKLSADAVGSFHVQAVVDPYGDGKTGEGGERPPSISLNLVLVHVQVDSLDCAPGSRYLRDTVAAASQVTLHAGAFANPDKRLRGVNLSAKIVAVGGGPRGRLGINKLACGWVQNIVACRSNPNRSVRIATYRDLATNTTHNVEKIFVTSAANTDYLPTGAAPQIAAFPILDGNLPRQNHNNHAPTTLSTNQMTSRDKSVGVELTVTANDSPNEAIETVKLPGRPTRVLESIDWELCFSAYLCCWSFDADRVLGVLNQTDWEIRQRWQVGWATPPTLVAGTARISGNPTLTAAAPPALTVTVQHTINELTPASKTRLEIGQPSVHHAQADDCRA